MRNAFGEIGFVILAVLSVAVTLIPTMRLSRRAAAMLLLALAVPTTLVQYYLVSYTGRGLFDRVACVVFPDGQFCHEKEAEDKAPVSADGGNAPKPLEPPPASAPPVLKPEVDTIDAAPIEPLALPPTPAPLFEPFDLAQVSEPYRTSAQAARTAESQAQSHAADARRAAERGIQYASTGASIRGYRGQISFGKPHGYGRAQEPGGPLYSGEWNDGRPHGVGVETPPANAPGDDPPIRYEGMWEYGRKAASGVYFWKSGTEHRGLMSGSNRSGSGVILRASGLRYEGQWQNFKPHGYGAEWSPDGRLLRTGQWQDGRLVQ
jgi:hypothetical protein